MTAPNGLPFPQGINPAELKPDPCECGSNEWNPVRYVVMMRHRFRADIKFRVVKERDVCKNCAAVREMS